MTHIITLYYIIMISCISSGQWKIPVITGTHLRPCGFFTLNTLPGNRPRGVVFRGTTVDETGKHRVNDLFLFTCFQDTIVSC